MILTFKSCTCKKVTDYIEYLLLDQPKQQEERKNITVIRNNFDEFFMKHKDKSWFNLPEPPNWGIEEIHQHYSTFYIPKKSGGLREINAPDEGLKAFLNQVKVYFEVCLKILPHECAHAYVKERSTITSLKVHQNNKSNWFLKLDLKDFFPSHNLKYVLDTLKQIYPTSYLLENDEYKEKLIKVLQYAFLDDKLPQGTPLSPTLTNILMVGVDQKIIEMLRETKQNAVYTRYADDMLISSKYKFNYKLVERNIQKILTETNAPFKIKTEKTRFGSKAGANWNLGIMLNKDNNMTIGYKQNQRLKAMLFNLFKDYTNNKTWPKEDRMILQGQLSYYRSIQPETTQLIIEKTQRQFGMSLKQVLDL